MGDYLSDYYEVHTASNGKEAFKWLRTFQTCSLVIADLNMPELDGFTFLSMIRDSGIYGEIPVIIVSGERKSQVRIDCLKAGATDFITKPFNPEELQVKIDKIISERKKGQLANS